MLTVEAIANQLHEKNLNRESLSMADTVDQLSKLKYGKRKFSAMLPRGLYELAKHYCEDRKIDFSIVLQIALTDYLESKGYLKPGEALPDPNE